MATINKVKELAEIFPDFDEDIIHAILVECKDDSLKATEKLLEISSESEMKQPKVVENDLAIIACSLLESDSDRTSTSQAYQRQNYPVRAAYDSSQVNFSLQGQEFEYVPNLEAQGIHSMSCSGSSQSDDSSRLNKSGYESVNISTTSFSSDFVPLNNTVNDTEESILKSGQEFQTDLSTNFNLSPWDNFFNSFGPVEPTTGDSLLFDQTFLDTTFSPLGFSSGGNWTEEIGQKPKAQRSSKAETLKTKASHRDSGSASKSDKDSFSTVIPSKELNSPQMLPSFDGATFSCVDARTVSESKSALSCSEQTCKNSALNSEGKEFVSKVVHKQMTASKKDAVSSKADAESTEVIKSPLKLLSLDVPLPPRKQKNREAASVRNIISPLEEQVSKQTENLLHPEDPLSWNKVHLMMQDRPKSQRSRKSLIQKHSHAPWMQTPGKKASKKDSSAKFSEVATSVPEFNPASAKSRYLPESNTTWPMSASALHTNNFTEQISVHSTSVDLEKRISPKVRGRVNYTHKLVPGIDGTGRNETTQVFNLKTPQEALTYYVSIQCKVMFILRGLPGSGKTKLASDLLALASRLGCQGVSLSTDEYFHRNGRYHFDKHQLPEAHTWNKERAMDSLKKKISPIIIDNTNTEFWELWPYVVMALQHSYEIQLFEPDTKWKSNVQELARRNQHGVTASHIKKMKARYEKIDLADLLQSAKSKIKIASGGKVQETSLPKPVVASDANWLSRISTDSRDRSKPAKKEAQNEKQATWLVTNSSPELSDSEKCDEPSSVDFDGVYKSNNENWESLKKKSGRNEFLKETVRDDEFLQETVRDDEFLKETVRDDEFLKETVRDDEFLQETVRDDDKRESSRNSEIMNTTLDYEDIDDKYLDKELLQELEGLDGSVENTDTLSTDNGKSESDLPEETGSVCAQKGSQKKMRLVEDMIEIPPGNKEYIGLGEIEESSSKLRSLAALGHDGSMENIDEALVARTETVNQSLSSSLHSSLSLVGTADSERPLSTITLDGSNPCSSLNSPITAENAASIVEDPTVQDTHSASTSPSVAEDRLSQHTSSESKGHSLKENSVSSSSRDQSPALSQDGSSPSSPKKKRTRRRKNRAVGPFLEETLKEQTISTNWSVLAEGLKDPEPTLPQLEKKQEVKKQIESVSVGCSTELQLFSWTYRLNSNQYNEVQPLVLPGNEEKVIVARPFSLMSADKTTPLPLHKEGTLDRSCQTDLPFSQTDLNLKLLRLYFCEFSEQEVTETFYLCNQDIDWTSKMLLNSNPIFDTQDSSEDDEEESKLRERKVDVKDSKEPHLASKTSEVKTLAQLATNVVSDKLGLDHQELELNVIEAGRNRLSKIEAFGLMRLHSRSSRNDEPIDLLFDEEFQLHKFKVASDSPLNNFTGKVDSHQQLFPTLVDKVATWDAKMDYVSPSKKGQDLLSRSLTYQSPIRIPSYDGGVSMKDQELASLQSRPLASQSAVRSLSHSDSLSPAKFGVSSPDGAKGGINFYSPDYFKRPVRAMDVSGQPVLPAEFVQILERLYGPLHCDLSKGGLVLEEQTCEMIYNALRLQQTDVNADTTLGFDAENEQQILADEAFARQLQEEVDSSVSPSKPVSNQTDGSLSMQDIWILKSEINKQPEKQRRKKANQKKFQPFSQSAVPSSVWRPGSKKNNAESLRDIMEEEKRIVEKTKEEIHEKLAVKEQESVSVRLQRRELKKLYPFLGEDFLYSVFIDCGYQKNETMQVLYDDYSISPAPTETEEEEISFITLDKRFLEDGEDELDYDPASAKQLPMSQLTYQELRGEPEWYRQLYDYSLRSVQTAQSNGNYELAAFYREKARSYKQIEIDKNREAAEILFNARLRRLMKENVLDLHLYHVKEAKEAVEKAMTLKRRERQINPNQKNFFFVVTGRGRNSRDGVPKLKPAIIGHLNKWAIRHEEETEGMLRVYL